MQLIVGNKTYELDVIKPSLMIFATLFALSVLNQNVGYAAGFYLVVMLISFTFFYSLYVLIQRRKVSGIAVFYQIFLFVLLHPLIFAAFGNDHYDIGPGARPMFIEWIQFIAAHIIRAVDVLDIVGEYQISLQTIHHRSFIVGASLVAMHWIVDIFFLAVIFRQNALSVIVRGLESSIASAWWTFGISLVIAVILPPVGIITFFAFVFLLLSYMAILLHKISQSWRKGLAGLENFFIPIAACFVIFYLFRAVDEGWKAQDVIFLWPLDQFIRLIDIGDSLQIFQLRLHSAPINSTNAAMAIFFRAAVGVMVTKYIRKLRLLHLDGFGLSHEEIIINLKSTDENFQQAARKLIQKTLRNNPGSLADFIYALSLVQEKDKEVEDFVWEEMKRNLPPDPGELEKSFQHLVKKLVDPTHREISLKALNMFFPDWRNHPITAKQEKFFLGYLQMKDPEIVIGALEGLVISNEKSMLAVKKLIFSQVNYKVRVKGLQKLAENKSEESLMVLCKLLMSPSHELRIAVEEALESSSLDWRRYAARELMEIYRDNLHKRDWRVLFICLRDNHEAREGAVFALGSLGKFASSEISDLVQALVDPIRTVAMQASVALDKIDPYWYQSRGAMEQTMFLEDVTLNKPSRYPYAEEALEKMRRNRR